MPDIILIQADQCEAWTIGILDKTPVIQHDNPVMDGIEYGLQKFTFPGQPLNKDREIRGIEVVEPAEDAVERTGFPWHGNQEDVLDWQSEGANNASRLEATSSFVPG
ncbi:MAG: hypothetical protein BWY82_00586 [Verrucomicrobia bacterium ADurb.Bin474]|nr:MAG: hypothetical protein BWY82_00586 [Verrucomicrobia bacterium ADurb.Bin474]